jgi:phasin family protein
LPNRTQEQIAMATTYEFNKAAQSAANAAASNAANAAQQFAQSTQATAQQVAEVTQATAQQVAEATQQVATQATEALRQGSEEAMRQGQAAMAKVAETTRESMDRGMKAFEEFNASARGNIEVWSAAGRAAAQGIEAMVQQAAEYSRKTFEHATATMRSLQGARTANEVFQVQNDFMKGQFDAFVGEFSRMSETMLRVTSEVFEPITSKMAETTHRATEALKAGLPR